MPPAPLVIRGKKRDSIAFVGVAAAAAAVVAVVVVVVVVAVVVAVSVIVAVVVVVVVIVKYIIILIIINVVVIDSAQLQLCPTVHLESSFFFKPPIFIEKVMSRQIDLLCASHLFLWPAG